MTNAIILLALLAPSLSAADAVRFSGGACASQGNWVQVAYEQSNAIVKVLNELKDDPNCKALTAVLESPVQLTAADGGKDEVTSFSSVYRELQAVRQFLSPENVSEAKIAKVANFLLFRKTLDVAQRMQARSTLGGMSADERAGVDSMTKQLQSFLKTAKAVSDVSVETSQRLMRAIPQSKACFQNKPSQSLVIFSSIVNAGAALVSGGQISNVGSLISSVIQFNRELKFETNKANIEYERYKASVSCLVESTQESYCALKDAEDALDFFRGAQGPNSEGRRPMRENPMAGMIVLLRDTPVINNWFQKVLFGIDPKLEIEATMKNNNWRSIMDYIQTANSLPASFRDMQQVYREATQGADNNTKVSQVRDILDKLSGLMTSGSRGGPNFFTQAIQPTLIPFYLMGRDNFPEDYNPRTRDFDALFATWSAKGEQGLSNPDAMLDIIEQRMFQLIDKAQQQSSNYFSQRMVVDPQNLIVEGMAGPNVSAFKALHNVRNYFQDLIVKLDRAQQDFANDPDRKTDVIAFQATNTMLHDSIARLDRIIGAMTEVGKLARTSDTASSRQAARKSMDVIYEFGNMLISRDSFISARTFTAAKMDFTDSILRKDRISTEQQQLLQVAGRDIVGRLSRYFSEDPVVQRMDISQATPVANANLAAVEDMFAPVIYRSIQELNCKLKGGGACHDVRQNNNPQGKGMLSRMFSMLLSPGQTDPNAVFWSSFEAPTNDDRALENLRAKLCVQSLGFNRRDDFKGICEGATLVSEFSREQPELDLAYGKALDGIKSMLASNERGKLTKARVEGVCALRTYIRKNHIFRMYSNYEEKAE